MSCDAPTMCLKGDLLSMRFYEVEPLPKRCCITLSHIAVMKTQVLSQAWVVLETFHPVTISTYHQFSLTKGVDTEVSERA